MSKNDGISLEDDSCLECGARYYVPSCVEGLCADCFATDLVPERFDSDDPMDIVRWLFETDDDTRKVSE